MDLVTGSIEAFLELGSEDDPLCPSSYSAGYRIVGTGEVVCAVKLPVAIAESAILSRSKFSITLSPSGEFEISVGGATVSEPIDGVVVRAVTEANLRMEEATASDLETLLRRLE